MFDNFPQNHFLLNRNMRDVFPARRADDASSYLPPPPRKSQGEVPPRDSLYRRERAAVRVSWDCWAQVSRPRSCRTESLHAAAPGTSRSARIPDNNMRKVFRNVRISHLQTSKLRH
jgi:hypothetical protein